ncbi:MAG: hypothetical protein DMF77_18440 [Acidobacteria bacterium]|nr:MAG: hypothetical protein DMF77_18440 [Acidobacteriota bacterium]
MSRSLAFVYLDGREVEGSSPRQVLEALRDGDVAAPPHDLGRFLDLVSSRGALTFSVTLEVGEPGADLDGRCRQALTSLIQHGWLRVKKTSASWPPRARTTAATVEVKTARPLA